MKLLLIAFSFVFACATLSAQSRKTTYSILNRIPLDGNDGWDYLTVDESTNRLFVSHGNQVQVIDLSTGKVAGSISDLKGVHGIAIAHDIGKAFISCGRDSSIVIVDLKTLKFIAKVKVTGANPDAILYDQFSSQVFAYNGRSANATVIDAKTFKIVGTIPLDGKPEFSVTDGKGKIFVNNEDNSNIYVINAKTLKVENKWPIAPGEEPTGLAIDLVNHRLFSVADKLMIIVDSEKGNVVAQVPIGEHVDGVMFDPTLKRAYSSNGEGSVTVVEEMDPNTFKVIETIPTQRGARTIGINTKTHRIYLPCSEYGETPAATKENPEPRPSIKPGTFTVLEIGANK